MDAKIQSIRRRSLEAPPEADYDALADTLLAVAAEVTEAEDRIKRALLEAAERGDSDQVARIVRRWLVEAPGEVAAGL